MVNELGTKIERIKVEDKVEDIKVENQAELVFLSGIYIDRRIVLSLNHAVYVQRMIYPAWVAGRSPRVIIIRQPIKIAPGVLSLFGHQFQLITCIFTSMVGLLFMVGRCNNQPPHIGLFSHRLLH